ncbi:hypothetical protein, partial [Desulfovibrio sp.]|uniref:hypothetical protein n=1 Tax=Desulfovibrio sp. TaxID=885 RepID=UPI003AF852AC
RRTGPASIPDCVPLPVSREEKRRYGICDTFVKGTTALLPAAADHVNAGSGSGGPAGILRAYISKNLLFCAMVRAQEGLWRRS